MKGHTRKLCPPFRAPEPQGSVVTTRRGDCKGKGMLQLQVLGCKVLRQLQCLICQSGEQRDEGVGGAGGKREAVSSKGKGGKGGGVEPSWPRALQLGSQWLPSGTSVSAVSALGPG